MSKGTDKQKNHCDNNTVIKKECKGRIHLLELRTKAIEYPKYRKIIKN
jgi:hypothetical protein